MDTDLFLTVGIVLSVLTIPSLVAAWADGRPPRVGALVLLAGAVLIAFAVMKRPGGYAFDEVPHVMLGVLGRVLN